MGKLHFILGTELRGSRYEELLHLIKSYIIGIYEMRKFKMYGSGTGPLQHRSQPGSDNVCQGKGKFGKLGRGKSYSVVYGSARFFGCEVHGPSNTVTIGVLIYSVLYLSANKYIYLLVAILVLG